MSERRPHILFTVLDWGLGHATRSIPLIRQLLERGARVSLAGEGNSLELLKQEFPQLDYHLVNGIRIRYPQPRLLYLWMFFQAFRLNFTIRTEHRAFIALSKKINPDAVISDNRYGAWVKGIPSFIICHQLQVLLPPGLSGLQTLFNRLYARLFLPFQEIWVPDMEDPPGLAGILSHPPEMPAHARFIGLLSRFNAFQSANAGEENEITAVVSGPEPHRSALVNKLGDFLRNHTGPSLLVTGKPQENNTETREGMLRIADHLDSESMTRQLLCSKILVLRPGYSTLMDLCAIGKTAICIPTPGQTEQEYLACLHEHDPLKVIRQQEALTRENIINSTPDGRFPFPVNTGVSTTIEHLLQFIG